MNDQSATDATGPGGWTTGAAALPVAFGRTIGLYTPPEDGIGASACAVLFLSPWGFEEMCTRKLWRQLAERFASLGVASLRFDYPGTGDSLDAIDFSGGLPVWEGAIAAAAAELRRLSGASRLILVGHGLGATFAAQYAGATGTVDATVLMAPVISGRSYLRETVAWSKMVDAGLGLAEEQRLASVVSVAGLVMPEAVAAAVRKIDLMGIAAPPAACILLVGRPARDREAEFAQHLESLGARVAREPYVGYDELLSNPTIAVQPDSVVDAVVRWVGSIALPPAPTAHIGSPSTPAILQGEHFSEEALRFGPGNRLFGVLCSPRAARRGASVILLGTAYDRQAGWARSTVETARYLAGEGIASLRFDGANVGDSPPVPAAPRQVLFSDGQLDDVRAALDLLAERGLAPAVLAGRCSGAYLAFQAAVNDHRCRGVVSVNPFTFVWNNDDDVDEALRHNPRSLEDYRRRAFRLETVRRLASGQIDLRRAAGNIGRQLSRRIALVAPSTLGRLTKDGRLRHAVHAAFRALAGRRVPMRLIYSEGDVGLERYRAYFGTDGSGMRTFPNVSVELVENADHNMSPPHARQLLRQSVLDAALEAHPAD